MNWNISWDQCDNLPGNLSDNLVFIYKTHLVFRALGLESLSDDNTVRPHPFQPSLLRVLCFFERLLDGTVHLSVTRSCDGTIVRSEYFLQGVFVSDISKRPYPVLTLRVPLGMRNESFRFRDLKPERTTLALLWSAQETKRQALMVLPTISTETPQSFATFSLSTK